MTLRMQGGVVLGFAILVSAAYLLGSREIAATAEPTSASAASPTNIERGRELYLTGCAGCHGADARGTSQGPTLWGVGAAAADFMLSTGRMPLSDPSVQAIRKPPAYSPDEIAALVAYVGSLGNGPPIPNVDLGRADLANGGVLYRLNCAPCHAATGNGGALSYGRNAPNLDQATSVQIAEAMRVGPGQMPVFGPDTLTDRQVDDIVAYVRDLRDPSDPGGYSAGHAGPIPEGLIALLVGVGGLLLVARRIEARP